ncbi:MAG: hypothetical protein R3C61_14480 [Bacteroidia bacterium]
MQYLLRKLKNRLFPGPADISDEFINRLFCANAGMLIRGNLLAFDYAIRHLPSDSPVVETGSYAGLSTNVIAYYLEKHNRVNALFTCDNWSYCGEKDHLHPGEPYMTLVGDHPHLTRAAYMDFVKQSFLRNVAFLVLTAFRIVLICLQRCFGKTGKIKPRSVTCLAEWPFRAVR